MGYFINRIGGAGSVPHGSLDASIAAAADDGFWTAAGEFYSTDGYGLHAGTDAHSYLRFTGITIPAGAVISSAYMSGAVYYRDGAPTSRVYANHEAAPTAPTTAATANAKTKTTAYASWTMPGVGSFSSPSLSAVIQEVFNAHGPFSSGAIMLLIIGQNTSAGDVCGINDHSCSPASALHIEW